MAGANEEQEEIALIEQLCQTSELSEFPPLASVRQLGRERGTEKARHTRLLNKIAKHIDEKGSKREVAVYRTLLADQLEYCISAHNRYVTAYDFTPDPNVDPDDYIKEIEFSTRNMYEVIDKYIRTSRSRASAESSIIENAPPERTEATSFFPNTQSVPADQRTMEQDQSEVGASASAIRHNPNQTKPTRSLEATFEGKIDSKLLDMLQQINLTMDNERQRRDEADHKYRTLIRTDLREFCAEQEHKLNAFESKLKRLENSRTPENGAFGAVPRRGNFNNYQSEQFTEPEGGCRAFTPPPTYNEHSQWNQPQNHPSPDNKQANAQKSKGWSINSDHQEEAFRTRNRSSVFRIPRIDLDPFDGNPKNWPTFIANFRDLVNNEDSLSNTQKMALLRKCLKPDIQASLGDCLNDPAMYATALEELETTYGHPHIVSRTYIRSILELPKVAHFSDYKNLLSFTTTLRGAAASLKNGGYEFELNSGSLLEVILEKLPNDIQSRWGRKIVKSHPNVLTLQDFVPWLHNIVKGEMVIKHSRFNNNQSTGSSKQDRKQGRQSHGKSAQPHPPTVLTTSTPPVPGQQDTKEESTTKKQARFKNIKEPNCPLCNVNHSLPNCKTFASKSVIERGNIVKEHGYCLRCLVKGHLSRDCSKTKKCGIDGCKYMHHALIHGAPRLFAKPSTESKSTESKSTEPKPTDDDENSSSGQTQVGTVTTDSYNDDHCTVLLKVVPITIHNGDKKFDTFALLDEGSEATLIVKQAAERIELNGPRYKTRLGSFHGEDPDTEVQSVKFIVTPRNENTQFFPRNSLVVPRLNLSKRKLNWPKLKDNWSHLADLEIPPVNSALVTVLLGKDVRGVHDEFEIRLAPPGSTGPDAVSTPFGWCATGPMSTEALQSSSRGPSVNHIHLSSEDQLRDSVKRLWETEAFGCLNPQLMIPKEDQRALQILETTARHTGDRQEIGLMWRSDEARLPDNKTAALKQFELLEAKFKKNPTYAAKYDKVIQEYLDLGHAELVDPEDKGTTGRVWYMPHLGVTTVNKPDKVRVVFHCSARYKGVCLNDVLLKGPDLLTRQDGILLKFRFKPFAVAGDIEKMYHQVQVPDKDRSALRFFYRSPGSTGAILTYQMTRHVFGAVSSPTTCLFALRKTAEDQRDHFPQVADLVKTHTYVDNLLYSADTEEELTKNAHDFKTLCSKGGFNVVQWMSTSRRFLSTIKQSEWSKPQLDLQTDSLPVERVLGLSLNWETDCFLFEVKLKDATTMRQILQEISSVHDPLGLISPFILPARIILQDVWRCRVGWDDPLPATIVATWKSWIENLAQIRSISIPRCVRLVQNPIKMELHAFSDASENGFGACVYLRSEYSSGNVTVALLLGKARVAPLRQLSIPRLELQGAVMASRLINFTRHELSLDNTPVVYWCDSQTVLQWIHSSTCRYHAFVAHRVTEINEVSSPQEWRRVPGELNPADDASRGIAASSATIKHRWYQGPPFLSQPRDTWPQNDTIHEPSPDDPEVSSVPWTGAIIVSEPHPIITLSKNISSLQKLKNVIGWLLRFTRNYPNRLHPQNGPRYLTVPELRDAMSFAIKVDQQHYFSRELTTLRSQKTVPAVSVLAQLAPQIDYTSTLRVGGRLVRGAVNEDAKHPIILHNNSSLARLIIMEAHVNLLHASISRTLHEIRSRFYILRIRSVIRSVVSKCAMCKRLNAQPAPPLMAPLPANRLRSHAPPFSITGIDYFGPLRVSILRRSVKRYGVLFTCLTCRAVHIELASSLDTDSFLLAFWRFANRRGYPSAVYSDNGTNLSAGETELRDGIARLDQTKIASQLATRSIEWHFSPPAAPHFGGVWERMVKSAKSALRIVLQDRSVNEEVLQSTLVGVEALINGRPLTHVSVDPNEPEALTPNHFLIGRANPNPEPDIFSEREPCSAKSWRTAQVITTHFWNRWLREYIPNLIERRKWLVPRRNLVFNDIVLVVEPNTRRGEWPLGRVMEAHSGADGVVRSATVRIWTGHDTKSKTIVRPTTKLCLLEADSEPPVSSSISSRNRAGDVDDRKVGSQNAVIAPSESQSEVRSVEQLMGSLYSDSDARTSISREHPKFP